MVLVVVVMACGGDDGGEPEGAIGEPADPVRSEEVEEPPDEEPPPVEDGGGEDDEPPTEAAEDDGDEEPPPRRRSIIAWLLDLGPSAPSGPSEIRAYEHLMTFDCAGLMERLDVDGHPDALNLAQSETLYRAAGTACLAAFDGRSELWQAARDLADRAGEPSTSCLDRATRRLLDDLLDAHDADATAIFEPATGEGDAQAPPCPRIDRLVPDHGPLGTEIRIEGANLHVDVEVHLLYGDPNRWDSEPLTVTVDSSTQMRVVLPARAPQHGSACVALFTSRPDWYADGRMFTFELPARDEEEATDQEGQDDEQDDSQADEQGDDGAEDEADEQADADGGDLPATTVACPPQL